MSTKIYTAWRCRIGKFDAVLSELRGYAFKAAAAVIRDIAKKATEDDLESVKPSGEIKSELKARLPKLLPFKYAFAQAEKASESSQRFQVCDIDASLNIWLYGGRAYVIGYGDCWFPDWFVPTGAEDYAYWNNTDQPDGVTNRVWYARQKMWDKVCLDDWNRGRLQHKIIDANRNIGLLEVAKLVAPRIDPYLIIP